MRLTFAALLAVSGVFAAPADADDSFHVFAPSRTSNKLLVVKATPSEGKLKLELSRGIDLGFPAATVVAHPKKPLLYVAASRTEKDETQGAVVRLNPDGSYSGHETVSLDHGYSYLGLDRASNFLLGVNYFEGFVDVYALTKAGSVGEPVAALNEGRRNAHCVLPTPDNKFVYIPYVKDANALYQYAFDGESGELTPLKPLNAGPPEGTGPRHLAYHPSKPIVYFSNEQHLGVSAYDIAGSGRLKLRQVCDAVGDDFDKEGVSSSDIAITADGRYLFAGIRGHTKDFDRISRYRVKPDGSLELLGLTPADKIPWGLALSPDGGYLMATSFQGGTLTAFRIGEDGGLTKAGSLAWDKNISDLVTVPAK